jgi:hypothetical protein
MILKPQHVKSNHTIEYTTESIEIIESSNLTLQKNLTEFEELLEKNVKIYNVVIQHVDESFKNDSLNLFCKTQQNYFKSVNNLILFYERR